VPLYDYQCRQCGKVAEVRHGFNETYEEPCAECKGEMRRVFSPAGIVFKGSGFYVTDSRKNAESSGASKSGGSSSKSEGASSGDGAAAPSGGETAKSETTPAKTESSSSSTTHSGGSSTSESAA
jgi:putative FmdB family regulatory protein